jgi:hypothetical protein
MNTQQRDKLTMLNRMLMTLIVLAEEIGFDEYNRRLSGANGELNEATTKLREAAALIEAAIHRGEFGPKTKMYLGGRYGWFKVCLNQDLALPDTLLGMTEGALDDAEAQLRKKPRQAG